MFNKIKKRSDIFGIVLITGVLIIILCKAYINQKTWSSWTQSDYYQSR